MRIHNAYLLDQGLIYGYDYSKASTWHPNFDLETPDYLSQVPFYPLPKKSKPKTSLALKSFLGQSKDEFQISDIKNEDLKKNYIQLVSKKPRKESLKKDSQAVNTGDQKRESRSLVRQSQRRSKSQPERNLDETLIQIVSFYSHGLIWKILEREKNRLGRRSNSEDARNTSSKYSKTHLKNIASSIQLHFKKSNVSNMFKEELISHVQKKSLQVILSKSKLNYLNCKYSN